MNCILEIRFVIVWRAQGAKS